MRWESEMKKLLRSIFLSSLTVAALLGQQALAQTTKATEAEAKMFAVSAGYERFMGRWSRLLAPTYISFAGVKNGDLLRLAAAEFDLLITVDRNLEYQQSFEGLSLAVIVVHASSNDITILRPLMPAVGAAIAQTRPGVVTHVREQRGRED